MPQTLVSVPPALATFMRSPEGRRLWDQRLSELSPEGIYVGADPRKRRLGSGGGTVHLLHSAWRLDRGRSETFEAWLPRQQRLVLHAGGESRRLPAYAALGKAFLPLPPLGIQADWRFDQRLMDLQLPAYGRVLAEAGRRAAVMVTSGDVWLDFNTLEIPAIAGDIVGIGMRVSPEVATHFGVYFVKKGAGPGTRELGIDAFLQKPPFTEIHARARSSDFYVDTGMWLFSTDAVALLFRRCGWDPRAQAFATQDRLPLALDLYTEVGAALGSSRRPPAALARLGWSRLRTAVIPLPTDSARFHHLGSSRQLFESVEQIQVRSLQPQRLLRIASGPAPAFGTPAWLEGASLATALTLEGHNIVTGLPPGSHLSRLGPGCCVDVAPVRRAGRFVLRPYHLDDTLRGRPDSGARICGRDAAEWLAARALPPSSLDVYELSLYPVLPASEIGQAWLDWFFTDTPDPVLSRRFAALGRLSVARIADALDYSALFALRNEGYAEDLRAQFSALLNEGDSRVFAQDFAAIAAFCRRTQLSLGRWILRRRVELLAVHSRPEHRSRLLMLFAVLTRGRTAAAFAATAHRSLQTSIVSSDAAVGARPRLAIKEDQIVWARSPVRLDLAGGWTDTPPYCIEHGGAVLNIAVLLNGQPPIQVFIRPVPEHHIRLRSIDLGSYETLVSHDAVAGFRDPRSGFSLAKAALALAGFLPEFLAGRPAPSLSAQLAAFGGGLEISLLSAVPKGSGLGTSSILASTLLGALSRACGLGWDDVEIYNRVLGVEQLLTTGGGWQDQAGALFGGVKLVQTLPGAAQTPTVRYLPEHLFSNAYANRTLLLYYTGLTRLAKNILNDIVQDMFLARSPTLRTLAFIRANAHLLHEAMQEGSPSAMHRCVARSWDLNRQLDRGTTTPAIERILAACGPDLAACKLLGAGGGGYLLLCAQDAESGRRIREKLESRPPNSRARFIDFQVSDRGLVVTVS